MKKILDKYRLREFFLIGFFLRKGILNFGRSGI